MMNNSPARSFPCDGSRFFIPGPVGQIESVASCAGENNKNVIAVICHPHPLHGGSMHNKVVHTLDKALNRLGALTVRFNFRGVGQSEGRYDEAVGEVDDLEAVLAWLRERLPGHQLWLAGFSFGAYIVMQAARSHNAERLITVAPPVNILDFSALQAPACPWLLIQGDDDEIVSSQQVMQWAQQFTAVDIVKLAGAGHFFHGKLNVLQQTISDHFSN